MYTFPTYFNTHNFYEFFNKPEIAFLSRSIIEYANSKKTNGSVFTLRNLFKNNFVIIDNSKHLSEEEAEAKFVPLVTKVVRKFVNKPIKNKIGKMWVRKQKLLNRRK